MSRIRHAWQNGRAPAVLLLATLLLGLAALGRPRAADSTAGGRPVKDQVADVNKRVAAEYDSLVKLYKHLHSNPELSLQEEKTAARMAQELKAAGFEVTTGVGGNGVVGVLRNGDGPTVLVRTDMDALPVVEQTGLEYASKVRARDRSGNDVGVMHACGHDMHMTLTI